ncbi:hypothetical protein [Cellulosilyticum ruminicola]|uniref:hypothetical protein n=1 Tax=Cellulosilyticum ruminicola TaxID=425254 RepID=UPI0006CFD556|nr:hypothetical protein [Cellulosilyticum ruminicola]
MGKEVPKYCVNLKYEEANRADLKAILLEWYVDLAIAQISELNVNERKLLINQLKAHQCIESNIIKDSLK